MAFTPVDVTDGTTVRTVETRADLNQAVWEGWVAVGGPVPPQIQGDPTAVPGTQGFLQLLAATFVSKTELVISPTRPTTADDGTVHIKNAT
jgi:hypothetical protein